MLCWRGCERDPIIHHKSFITQTLSLPMKVHYRELLANEMPERRLLSLGVII